MDHVTQKVVRKMKKIIERIKATFFVLIGVYPILPSQAPLRRLMALLDRKNEFSKEEYRSLFEKELKFYYEKVEKERQTYKVKLKLP